MVRIIEKENFACHLESRNKMNRPKEKNSEARFDGLELVDPKYSFNDLIISADTNAELLHL